MQIHARFFSAAGCLFSVPFDHFLHLWYEENPLVNILGCQKFRCFEHFLSDCFFVFHISKISEDVQTTAGVFRILRDPAVTVFFVSSPGNQIWPFVAALFHLELQSFPVYFTAGGLFELDLAALRTVSLAHKSVSSLVTSQIPQNTVHRRTLILVPFCFRY